MCHRISFAALMLLFAVGGCAPTANLATQNAATIGPHGGFAVRLPGEIGFGEVVIELASAERGAEPKAQLVVYFLGSDLNSALTPLPTDVSVKLFVPAKGAQTLALSSQPKPDDPAGAGRFGTEPGPLLLDEPIGELTAVLAGRPFTAPFSTVR